MMHLLAYTKASAGGTTNEAMTGVIDNFATLDPNNNYILQKDWMVLAAYGNGVGVTNYRLNTPYLRSVSLPSLGNIDPVATPSSLPAIDWYGPSMPTLRAIDSTGMDATNPGAAAQINSGLLLTDAQNVNVPQGQVYTLRATASITQGNLVWGSGSFVFDQQLPAGTYTIVGMDVIGANLVFARLNLLNGGPRPGCVARTAVTNKPDMKFRAGRLGVWGTFNSTAQPYIELFGIAAPTTQTIFLDVIKTG